MHACMQLAGWADLGFPLHTTHKCLEHLLHLVVKLAMLYEHQGRMGEQIPL